MGLNILFKSITMYESDIEYVIFQLEQNTISRSSLENELGTLISLKSYRSPIFYWREDVALKSSPHFILRNNQN